MNVGIVVVFPVPRAHLDLQDADFEISCVSRAGILFGHVVETTSRSAVASAVDV